MSEPRTGPLQTDPAAAEAPAPDASTVEPSAELPPLDTDEPGLLGRRCLFDGKLQLEGTLRVEGTLRGEVRGPGTLVIARGARLEADVDVGTLIVEGTAEGNLHGRHAVELRRLAKVRGSVTTPSLFIDQGVVVEGTCQVTDPDLKDPAGS